MQLPYRKPGKFTSVPIDPILTQKKYNELQEKLDRLKSSRPHAAREVARLAELGDFSENVEYQLAKAKLRRINTSILTLEHRLNQAEVIQTGSQTHTIEIGHIVTILLNGDAKTYQILGSSETNPAHGIISHTSPLGAALIGHSIDDEFKIRLGNTEATCRIISIE